MPPQGQFSTGSGAPGADFPGSGQLGSDPLGSGQLGSGQPDNDTLARRQPGAAPHPRQPGAPAARQPAARLIAPGGRHRRDMPASLPEGAPALVLAVPAVSADGLSGPVAEIATVL